MFRLEVLVIIILIVLALIYTWNSVARDILPASVLEQGSRIFPSK